MSMYQLNPSIPVSVEHKGTGECIGWIDYGPEHDLLWGVAFDSTGEVWWVPNPMVRFIKNYSLHRNLDGNELAEGWGDE
jgi:hypothetical protein